MIFFLIIAAVSTLALISAAAMLAGKPKKAEKSEKGAIIEQLLALSEAENGGLVDRTQT